MHPKLFYTLKGCRNLAMYSQSCHLKISKVHSSLTQSPNKNNNHRNF